MLEELRQNARPASEPPIWVPKRGEVVRVELEKVDWIAAEGPYVRIYGDGTSYLHRESITTMLGKIDSSGFARVHRSHLVRLVSIEAIRRTMSGGSELRLRNGEAVPVGRKYARDLRRQLMEAHSKD
jgi:DNA-binding LytR/AlgR family response regulator